MGIAVLIGTEKGAFLLRTKEAGRTDWQLSGPIFKGWKVTAAARARNEQFIVATASHVYGPMLHVSGDLDRWDTVEDGPRYEPGRKLDQIWTLVPVSGGIYAGVSEAGLFHATSPVGPWSPVSGLNDHPSRSAWQPGLGGLCAHVVLEHPDNPRQLWCGISAVGVFRSDDGGQTWHSRNNGIPRAIPDRDFPNVGTCVHGLAVSRNGILYRQDHLGLFRSDDLADSWYKIENGLPSGFGFPIQVDPQSGAVFVYPLQSDEYRLPADGAMAVYRSGNGGKNWVRLARGLPQRQAWASVLRGAMDVDGLNPCGVYLGTTNGTLHLSADGGDTWQGGFGLLPRILCIKAFVL
ncbi:MAG: exo-alpha-sialidase [Bacteroidota bacterium]|nr:exo-alpha-sialidase [Bacteroidota bacterium]